MAYTSVIPVHRLDNSVEYVLEVRGISDELCRKYGLSVIQTERSKQVAKPYVQWQAQKRGQDWKAPIRQDLDAAIAEAFTWRQFLAALERKGYTLHFERRDPSITPPGKEWRVRFKTLGPRYTPESIQRRILEPKAFPPAGTKPVRRAKLRTREKPLSGRSSLRALYYVYLYRMGVLPRKPQYPGYAVREDIRRLYRRIEQMTFLTKRGIDDRDQLAVLQKSAESEIAALAKERKKLYRTAPQGGAHRADQRAAQNAALHGQALQRHHRAVGGNGATDTGRPADSAATERGTGPSCSGQKKERQGVDVTSKHIRAKIRWSASESSTRSVRASACTAWPIPTRCRPA